MKLELRGLRSGFLETHSSCRILSTCRASCYGHLGAVSTEMVSTCLFFPDDRSLSAIDVTPEQRKAVSTIIFRLFTSSTLALFFDAIHFLPFPPSPVIFIILLTAAWPLYKYHDRWRGKHDETLYAKALTAKRRFTGEASTLSISMLSSFTIRGHLIFKKTQRGSPRFFNLAVQIALMAVFSEKCSCNHRLRI